MSNNLVDLEDYRKVWSTGEIYYLCCGHIAVSVFHQDSKKLECPKCGMMTEFDIGRIEGQDLETYEP
jgi:hypothetical protein